MRTLTSTMAALFSSLLFASLASASTFPPTLTPDRGLPGTLVRATDLGCPAAAYRAWLHADKPGPILESDLIALSVTVVGSSAVRFVVPQLAAGSYEFVWGCVQSGPILDRDCACMAEFEILALPATNIEPERASIYLTVAGLLVLVVSCAVGAGRLSGAARRRAGGRCPGSRFISSTRSRL
jgi:hypothetical protein